jgi:hypothetical protein
MKESTSTTGGGGESMRRQALRYVAAPEVASMGRWSQEAAMGPESRDNTGARLCGAVEAGSHHGPSTTWQHESPPLRGD